VSALDNLLRTDPEARRCLRFLVHGEGTLDDFLACYGGTRGATSADLAAALDRPFDDGAADAGRAFEEADELSEDELLAGLRRLVDATPADADDPASLENRRPSAGGEGLDEADRRMYDRLSDLTSPDRAFEEPAAATVDAPAERVLVPEDLVRSIEASYSKVSEYGFVTDADLADWLREATGAD
jgi:hypothetical protein